MNTGTWQRSSMRVGVINPKGGAGKSTLAVHLAGALASHGRVALVDLDDHATCLEHARGGHLPYTTTDAPGWDADLQHQEWTHVVVDGFARPTTQQLAALAAGVNMLLIPTPTDAASLKVLAARLPAIRATGAPLAVVVVMVPPWPSREGERALRDLRAGHVPTLRATVPRAAAFARAARARRLAWDIPRGGHLARVFTELAQEVIEYAQAQA
jgi:chromosome partitioning protein